MPGILKFEPPRTNIGFRTKEMERVFIKTASLADYELMSATQRIITIALAASRNTYEIRTPYRNFGYRLPMFSGCLSQQTADEIAQFASTVDDDFTSRCSESGGMGIDVFNGQPDFVSTRAKRPSGAKRLVGGKWVTLNPSLASRYAGGVAQRTRMISNVSKSDLQIAEILSKYSADPTAGREESGYAGANFVYTGIKASTASQPRSVELLDENSALIATQVILPSIYSDRNFPERHPSSQHAFSSEDIRRAYDEYQTIAREISIQIDRNPNAVDTFMRQHRVLIDDFIANDVHNHQNRGGHPEYRTGIWERREAAVALIKSRLIQDALGWGTRTEWGMDRRKTIRDEELMDGEPIVDADQVDVVQINFDTKVTKHNAILNHDGSHSYTDKHGRKVVLKREAILRGHTKTIFHVEGEGENQTSTKLSSKRVARNGRTLIGGYYNDGEIKALATDLAKRYCNGNAVERAKIWASVQKQKYNTLGRGNIGSEEQFKKATARCWIVEHLDLPNGGFICSDLLDGHLTRLIEQNRGFLETPENVFILESINRLRTYPNKQRNIIHVIEDWIITEQNGNVQNGRVADSHPLPPQVSALQIPQQPAGLKSSTKP